MKSQVKNNDWALIPAQHPEDQILEIVKTNREIPLKLLPKHLKRTSLWTRNLERQGLIKRVSQRGVNGVPGILLVATENACSNGGF